MLYSAYKHKGLSAVRYPRGSGVGAVEKQEMNEIPLGKGEISRHGEGVAILSFGTLLPAALEAAERINATVANMRFAKPLDADLIKSLAAEHSMLVTLEENVVAGGAGSGVNELLNSEEIVVPVLNLGLPDQYIEHGTQAEQLAECGLDAPGIESSIIASKFYPVLRSAKVAENIT